MNRESRHTQRSAMDDAAPSLGALAKNAFEVLSQVSAAIAAAIPEPTSESASSPAPDSAPDSAHQASTGAEQGADAGAGDDTSGVSALFMNAEAVRAFVMERLAGSASAEKLDPERVLHFLKNQAEDYWISAVTRWESVSRDVVDDLMRDAGERGSRGRRTMWSSMERWEGVARVVVEKAVDFSIAGASGLRGAGKPGGEASAETKGEATPDETPTPKKPWSAEPYQGDTRDL